MKAAFIGVTHHFRYTKSSQFFIDLLQEAWGEITVISSEWRWVELPKGGQWDLAVFWQHFPEPWELGVLPADRIVLVPMEDDCPHERSFWEPYLCCRVVCFSRKLADTLAAWGHDVLRVQYFPPPPSNPVVWPGGSLDAFFWPRKPDLTWEHILPLLDGGDWKGFHCHLTEPEQWAQPQAERLPAPVNVSRWYDTREAFSQDLAKSQVFFAPRRTEGIGLSFLEALGLGMAVVASDGSTMNEYIRSGVNGYLYDPEQPLPPEWTQAATWGDNARRDFLEGRERWTNSVPTILEFLSTAPLLTKRPGGKKAFRSRWGALARYTAFEFLNFLRTLKRLSKQIFSRGHL